MPNRAIRFCLALALWAAAAACAADLAPPAFETVRASWVPSEAWLLDRNGGVLSARRVDLSARRLEWVALADLSPALQETLVASEDKRFYEHGGVDWTALAGAAWDDLFHRLGGRHPRGASTITMQLAGFLDAGLRPRNSDRTLAQKWQQIQAAKAIDRTWSKQQILEAYLNLAPFRGELVGIHAAARALFGKHPSGLDRSEALLLVALLKAPGARAQVVAGHACAALKTLPAGAGRPTCGALREKALFTLDNTLAAVPGEDLAPHLAQKYLAKAGARIRTTLDATLQRFAIRSLRERLMELSGREVEDGAVIVIDNASGDVLAYVGSSGAMSDAPDVDGASALRQAGSTLKPFLYGLAIENRQLTAASVLDDSPIQLVTPTGLYVPQNYDHDFKGLVTVRTALASSLNVPAVRTLTVVGVDRFIRALRNAGLGSLTQDGDFYGFGLALGGAEVRLAELANAYRMLANGGVWSPIRFVPAEPGQRAAHRVFSREASFIVADILSDPGARATTFGFDNPLATRIWTAVKTGTSKDMRDNWCIGFSERYTVGVWVGNFSGAPMHDVSGVSGAAPVWSDIIQYLHNGVPGRRMAAPPGVMSAQVHFEPDIEAARTEWFIKGTDVSAVRLALDGSGRAVRPRILYPAEGTLIAIDPDIPAAHQRVRLDASGAPDASWSIDGAPVGTGPGAWWQPVQGRHRLTLSDGSGAELDRVTFDVRGSAN